MKNEIVPSIIARNQKEINERVKKVGKYFKTLQLDVMDAKFVKNHSLDFKFSLPKTKNDYEAHLMVKNPEKWIDENWKKTKTIIFHIEPLKDIEIINLIKKIKSKRRKVGIAINPKTKIWKIFPYLDKVDLVLIMTVNPGRYGSKFIPSTLNKVKELRNLKPKLDIEVDGGMNEKTIPLAIKTGANRFAVGSYLRKRKDMAKVIKEIKLILKENN